MELVASVAISGGRFRIATRKPFRRPNARPIRIARPNANHALSIGATRLMIYIGTYIATHPIAGNETSIPPDIMTIISQSAKHIVKMAALIVLRTVAKSQNAGWRIPTIRLNTAMI